MSEDRRAGRRVSDADRDLVIRQLQEHCATGRLSLDELTERVAGVQSARTSADLAALTADLPAEEPAHLGTRDPAWRTHALVALVFMSALTGLWLATSDLTPRPEDDGQSYYWPFWLDLVWGMVLVLHYLRAAGRLPLPHRLDRLRSAEPHPVGPVVAADPSGPPAAAAVPDLADGPDARAVEALTAREREVLALVAAGHSNQQIASRLFISERTARTHVSHVLRKLGLSSRTQAALLATRAGLATPPGDIAE